MSARQAALIPLAATALAAATLAGCGSLGSSTAAGAPSGAVSAASASAPASPPDCASQFTSWRDGSGLSNLTAVQGDLGTLSGSLTTLGADMGTGADLSADEASVQQAAASLQSDTQTAQADLSPSCVPGLRKNVSAALTDYNRAAINCTVAITEVTSGNTSVATSDIYAANRAMNAGNGKIGKATAAIKAYSGN